MDTSVHTLSRSLPYTSVKVGWVDQCRQSETCLVMQISREAQLKKKEVDDVLGGSEAWKNVQTTTGDHHALLLMHDESASNVMSLYL